MSNPPNNDRLIILGAGPAGLTAAYELAKNERASTLFEADSQVGGISQTVNYKGYRFDIGGHRFFTKIDYVNELWHEILPEDFIVRERLSRIFYKKHFFNYPLKPLNAFMGLGLFETIHICLSYVKAKAFPRKKEEDFESWMVNRFGYRLHQVFFKTYTEKVWGMPCYSISADWAAQRINNLSLRQALTDALFKDSKGKDGEVVASLIEQFHYPRLGPGMMWEACQDQLAAKGNPTHCHHRVKSVRHSDQQILNVEVEHEGERSTHEATDYISSIPLRELVLSLDPPAPPEVLEAANALKYRDYLTVILIVDRAEVFADNWIYIHEPDVKMGRIQNYKNWSEEMVPDSTKTSLGLEYFLWESDEEWDYSEEQLIELGKRECIQLGLITADEVIDGCVVRQKKAYPIYDDAYQERLAVIKDYVDGFINLQTVGRNGLHRYNNQDHSMMTGVYAARNIMGESLDVWAVNTDKSYHETKEGGDRLTPQPLERDEAATLIDDLLKKLDPIALGIACAMLAGAGLALATAILLLKGGEEIGPTLGLLSHFLPHYAPTWSGLIWGSFEAAGLAFLGGACFASLRNRLMLTYARRVQKRMNKRESQQLLEKV